MDVGLLDPNWIIILVFIYLDDFRMEKIGGINLQGHFSGRSQFGKLGFGTFRSHFEELKGFFLEFGCSKFAPNTLIVFYTLIPFQRCRP
jgi:hypothetical protein